MPPADNPVVEPVLSDLLYKDIPGDEPESVEETGDSQAETETVDEEVAEEAESEESESESEESDADTDNDAEPDTELFEVPEGDKTVKVNRKELVDGYLRQSDYTRKTQAVADERKTVETQKAQVDESLKVLQDISGELGALIMGDVNNIDWDAVRVADPSEYLRLKEVEASRSQVLNDLVAKRNKVVQENTVKESEALHKALGWSDQAKKDADIKLVTGYMQEKGITDQVASHKLMLALHEAADLSAKAKALEVAKVATLKEVKKAPKTTKPVKTVKQSGPQTLENLLYK